PQLQPPKFLPAPRGGQVGTLAQLRPRRRGRVDRGQRDLELVAQMLEPRGQDEPFAEMLWILVDGESRTHRRDLEKHAARLAEVDRPEPVAVNHRRRVCAGLDHAIAPVKLLIVERSPGDVMDRARAGYAALRRRRIENVTPFAARAAGHP